MRALSAYVIANVTVHDRERYRDYTAQTQASIGKYGGRFVVRGGEVELLEGTWDTVRMVVIEFPDANAARAWWESEEYAPLKAMRRDASDTNIVLVEGV